MSKGNKRHLCNQDCNNCEAIENKQLAVLLNVLALKFGDEVWHITNHVCPNVSDPTLKGWACKGNRASPH